MEYTEQQPGQSRKRNRPNRANWGKTTEYGQERRKPFANPPAGQYPALMPPLPPVEPAAKGKGKGGKGGDKVKGKGKGKGKGSPWG